MTRHIDRNINAHARAPGPALRHTRKWVVAAAALAVLIAAWAFLPVTDCVDALRQRLADFGPWGVPLFIGVYVAGVVTLVPGSVFSLTAGAVYGLWGIPVAIGAGGVGAALAFLVARHAARDRVRAWTSRRPRMRAVERAVSQGGWHVVVLLRLSPLVPFNLQNYVLGVTDIPFGRYVVATFLGIVPGSVLEVYIGTLGRGDAERGPLQWSFLFIGLVASVVLVWLVGRKAKRILNESDDSAE